MSRLKYFVSTATQMLVYFEIDKSTCILGAKFIKRIIGGNALIEGAAAGYDRLRRTGISG